MNSLLWTSLVLWIFLGVVDSQNAGASFSDLVIRHPKTSMVDFQIYRELHPGLRTLAMEWNQRSSYEEKAFECLELLRLLREAKLTGQINVSQRLEDEVWEQRFADDWTPPLRSLFLEIGINRAIRPMDSVQQRKLLEQALGFATSLHDLHSLPLWKDQRLQSLLRLRWNTRKLRTVPVSHWRQLGFHVAKINGMTFSLETISELRLAETNHRFTLLSNSWAPWSKVLENSEVSNAEPDLISLVQGDCQNPRLHPSMKEFSRFIHVVFDRVCSRVWREDDWDPISTPSVTQPFETQPIPLRTEKSGENAIKKFGVPLLIVGLVTGAVVTFLKSQNASHANPATEVGATGATSAQGSVVQIPSRL